MALFKCQKWLLCPPAKKRGRIVLLNSVGMSVGRSVDKRVSDHYLKTNYHRAFIFHMLIGHEKNKTHIDVVFTRSISRSHGLTHNGFRYLFS